MERTETYSVWVRGDGYIGCTSHGCPRSHGSRPFDQFTEILSTSDWPAAHARIRAERTAVIMNEDLWPLAETAAGNRTGVILPAREEGK